jgi:hypothetical protein
VAEFTADEALALVATLTKRLDDRAPKIEKYERYYEGKHNLRFATRKYREAFGALFREFADNWCGVVIDATVERMRVEGFRFPTPKKEQELEDLQREQEEAAQAQADREHELAVAQATERAASMNAEAAAKYEGSEEKDEEGNPIPPKAPEPVKVEVPSGPTPQIGTILPEQTSDEQSWKIWQRNNLDLYSDIAHETMLVTGHAYVIVGPRESTKEGDDTPLITVEHPLEVITQHAPGDPKDITAAVKRWWDEETGVAYATLYTPDTVYRYQGTNESREVRPVGAQSWVPRSGVTFESPNPFKGVVPVVPLTNRQKLNGSGRSELIDLIPLQDAVNKLTNDMLVASEFSAFRQRILTGMEIPEDEHGNIIPDFDLKASINRLLIVKDEDVKVHEFGATDLSNYVKAIEHLRDSMAAISRTPPQYLVGQVVNVSGEALKAAESGLVQKVKRRERFTGEGWEEVMRLAFLLEDEQEKAECYDAETIWGNPEIMSDASMADSLAKWAGLGVPKQALWERGGASPQEVRRWLQLRAQEPPEEGAAPILAAMIKESAGEP